MRFTRFCCRPPASPQRRKIFTVRRRPYDSVRVAVSLCRSLFKEQPGASSSAGSDACAAASWRALTPFLEASANAPPTLHHEGPLDRSSVTSLRDHLRDGVLQRTGLALLFDGAWRAQPHPQMATMWDATLQKRYTAALLDARQAQLRLRKETAEKGSAFDLPRHEAGLTLLDVLGGVSTPGSSASAVGTTADRQATWRRLIRAYSPILPDRSRLHEIENGPQEIAMGELVREQVRRLQHVSSRAPGEALWQPRCVVDVGGGNGFLVAQLAEQLACGGLVVDPHMPLHAIDCLPYYWPSVTDRRYPAQPRRQELRRVKAFVEAVNWRDAVPVSPDATVLIAKHLCGSAIDACLRHMRDQHCLPRIVVWAPCCFNKIQLNSYCDADFLADALSIKDQDTLVRLTRLTDWNMSCCQHANEVTHHGCTGTSPLVSLAATTEPTEALVSMQSSTRYGGIHSVAHHVPCMHAISQVVEGIVNLGRARWLRAHGYTTVEMVQYVPDCVTAKNKCLIAVRE